MKNTIRRRKEIQTRNESDSSQRYETVSNVTIKPTTAAGNGGRQRVLFGFVFSELTSWQSFVKLMCRPTDPAALGVLRFLYGVLLMIETLEKQGLGRTSYRRWSSDKCTFPVLYFLKPLPLDWMYLLHFVMLLATIGITLGFMYRWCLVLFNGIYWYTHFLDMQIWNNHSYLFGLLSFLLLVTDGNRYFSIDSFVWPKLRNQDVPLWNYTLLRFQVFLLYFLAGIKKMDAEWLYGHSEKGLSIHWVFDIFRPFLSNDMIDLYMVHRFGFLLDLSLGFILFFDETRKVGILMALSFHAMNSQIFSIGMFPYIGIVTLTIFCYPDWPRKISNRMLFWQIRAPTVLKYNPHCLYSDDRGQTNGTARWDNGDKLTHTNGHKNVDTTRSRSSRANTYHTVWSLFVLLYAAEQLFLPFSSVVFKGLTTWGGDLYGYTWNMMIHQHKLGVTIYIKDLGTGERVDMTELLSPLTLNNKRWSHTPAMLVQFTHCIARKLEAEGHANFAINYDVWFSLNRRFYQRLFDPNKDILNANWSIFSKTDWWMPPTEGFWEMREIKNRIQKDKNATTMKLYKSDFSGFHFPLATPNTTVSTLEVLKGTVILEDITDITNVTVTAGESVRLSREQYNVHTVSTTPSYYVISRQIMSNDTRLNKYKAALEAKKTGEDPEGILLKEFDQKEIYAFAFQLERQKKDKWRKFGPNWSVKGFTTFLKSKYTVMKHGLIISMAAIRSIAGGEPFTQYITRRPF